MNSRQVLVSAAALLLAANVATAQNRGGYVVGSQAGAFAAEAPFFQPVEEGKIGIEGRAVRLVLPQPVVAPEATVSRALSDQPTQPHLVNVELGGLEIKLDPYEQDLFAVQPGLDEGHRLVKAAALARQVQHSSAVQVVRSSKAHRGESRSVVRPRAIIHIPQPERFQNPKRQPQGQKLPLIARAD